VAYSAQTDILEQLDEDILIQLTDDVDAGVVDDDAVTRAIADADSEIDSYCGAHYEVPFSDVPAMVRKLSVDISIYNLYARRKGAPEDRKQRYDSAIRFLRDISTGKASLGSTAPDDSDGGPEITTKKSDRKFSIGRDSDRSSGTLDNY